MGHENDEADEIGEYADHERPSWISKSGGYDHFEFITTSAQLQSDLCPADYLFVSGKLLPMKHQTDFHKFPVIRSDSGPSSDGIKRQVVRNYSWKSDRSSVSSNSSNMQYDLDRNYSYKSNRTSSSGSPRTRWHSFIYGMGMITYPLKMELRDIKHRQSRRGRPASLFLATPDLADRGRGSSSWGLIKALSCKDHTSTSVNASFVLMPNV